MKYAITLRFDEETDQRLAELRSQISESASVHDPYPSHITLAAFEADLPSHHLWQCLDVHADGWSRVPITLSGIGIFPGPRPVVWAAPAIAPLLLEAHVRVHNALRGVQMYPHFDDGVWVPHTTLVTKISALGRTVEALSHNWQPIGGFLDRLDLITFPPVRIEHSILLPVVV